MRFWDSSALATPFGSDAQLVSVFQIRDMRFVTLDENLANCASREGFAVIPHL